MDNTTTMTQGLSIRWDKPRWTPGRVLMWILCLTPSAWFALFALFVLRATLAYGQLPSFGSPDPKELGFIPHYYAIIIAFVMAFFAPFVLRWSFCFAAGSICKARDCPLSFFSSRSLR